MNHAFVAPMRRLNPTIAALSLVLAIAGCASNAGASVSPTTLPSEAASVVPSSDVATPSAVAASPSPSSANASAPAGSAGPATCMDQATLDLLTRKIMAFDTITPEEREQVLTAVKGYDFGTDTAGAALRNDLVAAIEAADVEKIASFGGPLVMGTLSFAVC